jgi:hypothetical protein
MKAKELVSVIGGLAYVASTGDVDVQIVDIDNINAGDAPVELPAD